MPNATQNRRRPKGRFSPEALAVARRDREAMELRRNGATFGQIAERLGYANSSGAYKAVQRGLACAQPDPIDQRRLELFRLETLWCALWPYRHRIPVSYVLLHIGDIQRRLTDGLDTPPATSRRREPTTAAKPQWTRALEAREQGLTFASIGADLGISAGAAHKRVRANLDAFLAHDAALLRDQAIARYDAMQYGLWDAATASNPPSLKAARAILRIIDGRCRLCNLYPKAVQG